MGAPTYEELRKQVRELRDKHDADTAALAELEQTLAKLESLQQEHADLLHEVEALRFNLSNLKRKSIKEKQLAYQRGAAEGRAK